MRTALALFNLMNWCKMFLPQRHEEHKRKLRFLLPWFVSSQTNCITIPIYIFLPRSNKGLEGKTSFFSSCAAGVSMYCCCSIVIPKGWHVYSKHCMQWCSTPKGSYVVFMKPCYKDLNPSDSFLVFYLFKALVVVAICFYYYQGWCFT